MVLNTIARRVIESRRGKHKDYVFTYRGNAIGKLNNSAWKRAWRLVGLPTEKGILKGVHNLRHYSEFRIIPSTVRWPLIILLLSVTCAPLIA